MKLLAHTLACVATWLHLAACIHQVAAEESVDKDAPAPLVLEFSTAGITQEVVVRELSEFRVVTQVGDARWEVAGKLGKLVDETMPVELRFQIEQGKQSGTFPLQLKIDENRGWGGGSGPGSTIGAPVATGIWLRRGLDPVPSMVAALAYRDQRFSIATKYLGQLGTRGEAAVDDLVRVLAGPNELLDENPARSIRGLAAESLGNLGPTAAPAVEALSHALADENVYVRMAAARALWKIDSSPLAVPALLKELEHPERYVRQRAIGELGSIGPAAQPAEAKLIELLRDENPKIRRTAAAALGGMGPAALAAESELKGLLSDVNEPVRAAAATALTKLRDRTPNPTK